MGMFDTFVGEVKCSLCGGTHEFEEQTKNHDCILDIFKLGDYVDRANQTYIHPFEAYCSENKEMFACAIIVVRGQIVKYINSVELSNMTKHIEKLENIEDGLGWKQDYQKRCEQGLGYNNDFRAFGIIRYKYEDSNWKEHPKKIGDRLLALNDDWLITNVYKEVLREDKSNRCYSLYKGWFHENFVYQVTNSKGKRFARVTNNNIELMYDNGFKIEWDSENPSDYFIQRGCDLVKIENK